MSYIQAAKLGRHALASLLTVTIRIETLPSFFPAYEVLPIGAKRDCCCSTLVAVHGAFSANELPDDCVERMFSAVVLAKFGNVQMKAVATDAVS